MAYCTGDLTVYITGKFSDGPVDLEVASGWKVRKRIGRKYGGGFMKVKLGRHKSSFPVAIYAPLQSAPGLLYLVTIRKYSENLLKIVSLKRALSMEAVHKMTREFS